MAVLWQKHSNGKRYEVRSAGQTRRLYTNGVFHSQYNPNYELTSNVWDLLSLPSFFLNEKSLRNILVLGVGGGAIIRQFNNWYPKANVVGIELDSVHIQVAKRFFNIDKKVTELIEADAVSWIKSYRGHKFDLIIEDIFTEDAQGEPLRVAVANKSWMTSLFNCLSPAGVLVMNFTEAKDFRNCACFHDATIKQKFNTLFRLTTPLYENVIGALCKSKVTLQDWNKNISVKDKVAREYLANTDKYTIRKVKI